jgi:ribosomal-protein-alanine N-acetyltransferase
VSGPAAITPVGPDAAALLAALHEAGIGAAGPHWSEAAFATLLALPGRQALIAGDAGEPLGMLVLGHAADEAEILTLAVLPAAQRRGVGAALVAAAQRVAARQGATRMFLEVAADNAAARALYAAAGFVPVGLRRGYYERAAGAVDALVLALPLTPPSS